MKGTRRGRTLKILIQSEADICKIAEIGIFKSGTCRYLLEELNGLISQYWAVDPWASITSSWIEKDISNEKWQNNYLQACQLMTLFPQLHIVRAKSMEAARLFSDGYFDLVFLDADHSYEAVKADIETWLPLIRKKGILIGHDYGEPGVVQAVDECFGTANIERLRATIWFKRLDEA